MFIARLETKTKPYSSTYCMTENVMEILDKDSSLILINRNTRYNYLLMKNMHPCKEGNDTHKLFNKKIPFVSQYEI